jgi:hypothetical protein
LKSTEAETGREGLTPENHLSRFALLNPLPAVEISRETFLCRKAEAGAVLPSSAATEQLSEGENLSGYLILPQALNKGAQGTAGNGNSRICAMYMTKNEKTRAAIPHQDARNLSSRSRFFLPRGNRMSKQGRRETTEKRRIRHGIARALENLRGVRLSLVPRPNPGECLLQGM